MKKYLNITRMVILEKSQYIYNQLFKMVSYALFIYIFLQLWKYIYGDSITLAGYTLIQMIWYFSFTEIVFGGFLPRNIRKELSEEIRSGKIAYILNKPFNYILYVISKYFGEVIVNIFTYLIPGLIIAYLIVGPLNTFSLISIPFILIILLLAALILCLIYILISLLAFWIEENKPFFWIYEKLVLCLGVMFPIEVFPTYLQSFIRYSPIYVTIYAPSKIFVDFSYNKFFELLFYQFGYIIFLSAICILVYKRGVKRLNVNGG